MPDVSQPPLTILLAGPRGFCAGVERAIDMVKVALRQNGAPVYVRHEIVHNRHVVDELRALGAVFVEELDEVPEDGLVVFSAHGVPKSVPADARARKMLRDLTPGLDWRAMEHGAYLRMMPFSISVQ